jgi:hypothetical protein
MGALMGRGRGVWIVGILALAGCFALCGAAKTKDPPWIAKDWTQWTMQDCTLVATRSPWSQYYSKSNGRFDNTTVKLRSALPVRLAGLRVQQLEKHYENMNSAKKQEFDQQHAGDAAPSDDAPILLDVFQYQYLDYSNSSTNGSPYPSSSVSGVPPGRQLALRLPGGSLVMPTEIAKIKAGDPLAKNEYLYTFPRMVNDEPAFSGTDGEIIFVFGGPIPEADKQGKVAPPNAADFQGVAGATGYRFKISDLMYKGKLEY